MSTETQVSTDVVIRLSPGQSTEIPKGPVKATVENLSNEEGSLYFIINPPPQTEGTIPVPARSSRPLALGPTGGKVTNTGKVSLTIVYFIG